MSRWPSPSGGWAFGAVPGVAGLRVDAPVVKLLASRTRKDGVMADAWEDGVDLARLLIEVLNCEEALHVLRRQVAYSHADGQHCVARGYREQVMAVEAEHIELIRLIERVVKRQDKEGAEG